MSETDLVRLMEQSDADNKKRDITGMLLFLGDRFIQVLEGQKDDVIDLFDQIAVDPRHKKVSILLEGITRKRTFQDWTMGFETTGSDPSQMPEMFRDPKSYFGTTSMVNQKHPTISFLKLFYEKNVDNSSSEAKAAS